MKRKEKEELFNLCYIRDHEIDRLLRNEPIKCDTYMLMCLIRYWKGTFDRIIEKGLVNEYYRYVRKRKKQEQRKQKKN